MDKLSEYMYYVDTWDGLAGAARCLREEIRYRKLVLTPGENEIIDRAINDIQAIMWTMSKRKRDIYYDLSRLVGGDEE